MRPQLETYQQSREALLEQFVRTLSGDERLVAAWLTGSYARNEADEMSDLDITLAVAEPYSKLLCVREEQVSHRTTAERFALFSQFGVPALIHENNHNAPEGGTFTFVMYGGSALMVDWILIPLSKAKRPHASRLLFDKAGITISSPPEPEALEQSRKHVAEQWAFFWMMTAITIKYLTRGDQVFVIHWLEYLHGSVADLERRLRREPWKYTRGSLSELQPTREKQIESIRSLCQKMQALAPQAEDFSGTALALPLEEIERLIAFADEEYAGH